MLVPELAEGYGIALVFPQGTRAKGPIPLGENSSFFSTLRQAQGPMDEF